MTSKPVFSYPIPHSTFIPLSYESVTASGQTRKRKRTKSLATNASENIEGEEEEGEEGEEQAQNKEEEEEGPVSKAGNDAGLRSLATPRDRVPTAASWAPTGAHKLPPALTTNSDNTDDEMLDGDDEDADDDDDDDDIIDGKRKRLASNLEHRIRNAGYADDIMERLPPTQPTSLQAKHLSNINTLLHLCILRRDWGRAKRAFRLLLLSDSETDVKNLRLKTIWKLGVEILSWEYQRPVDVDSQHETDGSGDTNSSKRSYAKAVEYMDRLVIMYPHYKHYVVGKGVNATTILPILMHFEILALHEKLSTALKSGESGVVLDVISGIEALVERLKTLQETPPWVDMGDLWRLRGQLYTWAADLSLMLLNDQEGHIRYKIAGHKLSQRMKERGLPGWEEYSSERDEVLIEDNVDIQL
ncbi:hypothetical protein AOL_s00215g412 [Orbilia oligospora ATCC 24927]|uniref:Uncharacterized protein n=1 Tax=Arthrobotrys oligospora (strain ATCC 24927 / CBS 115.81 / DSM 1491) TaxID=756982 RepID=G1XSR4_ARTOA|nr:hypothetical protein AOL_s00215g412 [Orbilia oligospora ATCC 24927]EGX43676.1 hypothetical protein AOL_s00215g412 [Orbilia oligospora ATCC 24927]